MAKRDDRDDWDDGRTIAPMNGDELPAYRRAGYMDRPRKSELKNGGKADLTRKERRAMARAMFLVMLPRLLVVLAGFGLTILLLWLWLL